ncbi:hypothetical protein KSX_50080 [Ktedonospora formicarum]|uniref:Uncharacterized protein n=1 Tax=Ktedonospora formicarum TaxID=2778364 RepID=A0A8J3I540_9CHLR|nr:hypothetical protein KSX_50080 [Ktedonospora formicarum]
MMAKVAPIGRKYIGEFTYISVHYLQFTFYDLLLIRKPRHNGASQARQKDGLSSRFYGEGQLWLRSKHQIEIWQISYARFHLPPG